VPCISKSPKPARSLSRDSRNLYDLRDVVALARHASMSTTYKPALLKAIVRIISRKRMLQIPLTVIGAEFTKLYWNQTVVFHLRQAAVISKESEVLRTIRNAAECYGVRELSDLPHDARNAIEREMARILTIDVLRRFHNSKPAHMPPLFTWDRPDGFVKLSSWALDFIVANSRALETLANYWWAKYLEKINVLAPLVIEKVERDGARRGPLAKYLKILRQIDEAQCFYCGRDLSSGVRVEVDHVLPWTFLLADPIWDLVLSCANCNAAKSDRLPERRFIDQLIATNERRHSNALPAGMSPLMDGSGIIQLYEAAISVEWPRFWRPAGT
jgi:hypothetical protein